MPKVQGLTTKERRFVHEYAKSRNISQSAMVAYDCNNSKTAYAVGKEILEKPRILDYLSGLLDQSGLSDEKLTQDLAEIIETGKNSYQATAKDALRGIEMAFKLKGKFPARKEHLIERRDLRLELRGMSDKELRERFETIQESLKDYFEATNQPGTHPD